MDWNIVIKLIEISIKLFPHAKKLQILYSKKKGYNFIIEELEKWVTVYKDGHGILREKIKFKILNPQAFTEFPRRLNIEDAKKGVEFAPLDNLMKCDLEKRFSEMGFWYSKDAGLIDDVQEFYWNDDPSIEREDAKSKENPREIRFKFKINNGVAVNRKNGTIEYAFSIPGMFPIKDGYFDTDSCPKAINDYLFNSGIRMDYIVEKMKYVVAFENGIEFTDDPNFKVLANVPNGNPYKTDIERMQVSDLFYKRFYAETTKPSLKSRIVCNWGIRQVPVADNKQTNTTMNEMEGEFAMTEETGN